MNRPSTYSEFFKLLRSGSKYQKREADRVGSERYTTQIFHLQEIGNQNTFELFVNDRKVTECVCFIGRDYIHKVNHNTNDNFVTTQDLYFVEIEFVES